MHTARITVLLKKDPLSCSFFWPISLLDFDYKIITKLLAKRLNTLLPKIIKADKLDLLETGTLLITFAVFLILLIK